MISILDGDPDSMVSAASSAAEEAREHLEGAEAAGVLVFDCVCHGMILKRRVPARDRPSEASSATFPSPGFSPTGDRRYEGRLEGWHNATAVVVAIPK